MENPFRSEAAAFQFLLVTVVAFALITIAAILDTWAGLAVFIALTAGAIAYYLHQRGQPAPRQHVAHRGGPEEKRVLVIANETLAGERLLREIKGAGEGFRSQVLVVAPVLSSPVRHWTSDTDSDRSAAEQRLAESLARLRDVGIEAGGEVGDEDPVQAIEDALRTFGADEIIISTHPEGRSSWLERGVVSQARDRFAVPITHVVVDLTAETDQSAD